MPSEPGSALLITVRPPGRAPYAVSLPQLTALVRAARVLRNMNFLDKIKTATNVAADVEARAERDADALIARGAELDQKRERAFAIHKARMDVNHDALDRLEHAFDYLGNGAPPAGSTAGGAPKAAEPAPQDSGNAYAVKG